MLIHQPQAGSLYTSEGQRKYVTAAERQRFLSSAVSFPRPEIATLCLTLAQTGCRVSEALKVVPGAVSPEEGFITLRSLKRRGGAVVFREVPVPMDLIAAIEAVHDLRGAVSSAPLWTVSRSTAWDWVKLVMSRAGIVGGPHASPKGLRHGFAIHAIRSGVPLNLVQRWLGHSSIRTTAIYLQVMGVEEREIAARMWAKDVQPLIGYIA